MRRIVTRAVLLAVWVAMPLAAQTKLAPVVMTVNDQPVYSWEISLLFPQVQAELASRGEQQNRDLVVRTAVNRVVEARLLAQEARRRNLKPDSGRVDVAMKQIEEQAGGREGLDTVLGGLGATYAQLRTSVAESELVKEFVLTQIEPQVTVTPLEISAYYDQNPEMFTRPDMVRARHILVRITRTATETEKDTARARASAAHRRVVAGEDFASVATEVSEGPNASNGGDLGFFARDSMVPALANPAFGLNIGEISAVIETQFGFHVLKILEKRAASKMTLAEVRSEVEQLVRENKTGGMVSKLLAELAEAATIVEAAPSEGTPGNPGGD
jgi:peptidyl-prolyl cis-trans isomerase C